MAMTLKRMRLEHPGALRGVNDDTAQDALDDALLAVRPEESEQVFDGEALYSQVALDERPAELASVEDADGDLECELEGNCVRAPRDFQPPVVVRYVSLADQDEYEKQVVAFVRTRLRGVEA